VLPTFGCGRNESFLGYCFAGIHQFEFFALILALVVVVFAAAIVVAIVLVVSPLSIESASVSAANVAEIGGSSQAVASSKRRVRQVQKLGGAGGSVGVAFVGTGWWRSPRLGIGNHERN